ncbi:MAG: hypothetical protein A2560_16805 [Bdellovibrionales bacterium RIFOXYD1_FULL_39_84]|nr:MAG: hypothetical protein A2560_16805 [Bdellovibrionales bacterium RIFOXYD1_FULL_39_84]
MLASLIVTALLYGLFFLFIRDFKKSALYLFPFLVIFFAMGHISFDFVDRFWEVGPLLVRIKEKLHLEVSDVTLWAWPQFLLFGICYFFFVKYLRKIKQETLDRFTQALFVVSFLLIIFQAIDLANSLWLKGGESGQSRKKLEVKASANSLFATTVNLPDIYYIIPDGHPRADVLAKYHKFDNSKFIAGLEDMGFFVAKNSYSNYAATFLSITSSLNMRYINYFAERNGQRSRHTLNVYNELWDNEVFKFLHAKGYTNYHLQNSWMGAKTNRYADIELPCIEEEKKDDIFLNLFINSTMLYLFLTNDIAHDIAKCHMKGIEQLSQLYKIPGPKFVSAHLRPPHPPFVFDRDGNFIENDLYTDNTEGPKVRAWFHFDMFVDQMVFVDKQLSELAANIIANTPNGAIIIFQSDHGARIVSNTSSNDFRQARHANFTAIYHPDKTKLFDDNITPVNIFRIIFNHYLGGNFEILPNKIYYSEYGHPFDFSEMNF